MADPARRTWVRYGALTWLCLAATIAYICRNSISVASDDIQTDLDLSDQQMGLVMGAFFYTYAFAQIPTGWLAHVWGSRRAIPFFSILWSGATALMSLATGFWLLVSARLANGLAQAGLFPASTNTIGKWFPSTERAIASGALASFMSVGAVAGAALTAVMLDAMSWRTVFVIFSLVGVVWAVGFYGWFRDRPQDHSRVGKPELERIGAVGTNEPAREPVPWRRIFTSPAMGWICAQQFFRAAGYAFFVTWFPRYLKEVHQVKTLESGLLTALPLLGVVVGGLLGGGLSDWLLARTGSLGVARKGLAVVSHVACAILVLVAYTVDAAVPAVLIISAGSLCATLGGPCAYAITIDMGGRQVPAVFSTMNMCGNVGAMAFPIVVPWYLGMTGTWESVLLLFGATYLGAAACWAMLKPEGNVFDRAGAAR